MPYLLQLAAYFGFKMTLAPGSVLLAMKSSLLEDEIHEPLSLFPPLSLPQSPSMASVVRVDPAGSAG